MCECQPECTSTSVTTHTYTYTHTHIQACQGESGSDGSTTTNGYVTQRALEAELAVEQRLVSSLEAALAVCVSHDHSKTGEQSHATPAHARMDTRGVDQIKQLDATIQMLVTRLQRACEQPERSQQQLAELFKDKRALQHRLAALEKSEKEAQASCERQRRLSDKATNSAVRLRTENNRLKAEVEKLSKGCAAADEVTCWVKSVWNERES